MPAWWLNPFNERFNIVLRYQAVVMINFEGLPKISQFYKRFLINYKLTLGGEDDDFEELESNPLKVSAL